MNANSLAAAGLLWLLVVGLGAAGLRMINLDAPEAALQGDTIRLTCSFELQSQAPAPAQSRAHPGPEVDIKQEQLYAIKWYKDEREFFRYVAQEWQKKLALPADGLTVDVDKSDNRTVVLANVTLKASGLFRCEVSTEAPTFVTMSLQRRMLIHSLPNDGPVIRPLAGGGQSKSRTLNLALGARLELLCSAPESKPAAQLDWIINDTLNLSSFTQTTITNGIRPLYSAKSQRFVRLPTSNGGGATRAKVPNGRYELIPPAPGAQVMLAKATQVDPNWPERLQQQQQQQTVELEASSLEQLAESASSRLNLTVDSNLLQLLSQTSNAAARRTLRAPLNAADPLKGPQSLEDGHLQQQHQFLELKSQPIQVLASGRIKRWLDQRSQIAPHKSRPPVNTKPPTDQHKLTLKVRCSLRVLHLVMSDEIKVRITTSQLQQRTVNDDKLPARMELMQSKGKQGNSATPLIGTYVLLLTTCVLSLIIMSYR